MEPGIMHGVRRCSRQEFVTDSCTYVSQAVRGARGALLPHAVVAGAAALVLHPVSRTSLVSATDAMRLGPNVFGCLRQSKVLSKHSFIEQLVAM